MVFYSFQVLVTECTADYKHQIDDSNIAT